MVAFRWGIDRNEVGWRVGDTRVSGAGEVKVIDTKAMAAEFLAMILFVIIGCGVACGHGAFDGATRLVVAFAFGMGILVLAYSIGHHSGGQINCAVTFSLVVGGEVPWYQGVANVVAQLCGSLVGAGFLAGIFPCEMDMTTNLGTNIIGKPYSAGNALLGEIVGTFILCYTVWETAVSSAATCGQNAALAIGFSVFLAHLILLPIDGCSINPTRSFGPAIVSSMRGCDNYTEGGLEDLWVMFVGPLIGGGLAALVAKPFKPSKANRNQVTEIAKESKEDE